MEKKKERSLSEAGYIPVDRYVNDAADGLFQASGFFREGEERAADSAALAAAKSAETFLKLIRRYEEASEKFHSADGDGYYITLKCLQKYLDYKFIQENNHFRFAEQTDTAAAFSGAAEDRAAGPMTGTQADIYYLLYQADRTSEASRRCREYTQSRRLHLTAVLIRLLEGAVASMESSALARHREYGRLLRTVYMEQKYAGAEVPELLQILGCSKKQYYRLRSEAISFLSENLFGIFAGENGMAELYIGEDEIIIPSIKKQKSKKLEKGT